MRLTKESQAAGTAIWDAIDGGSEKSAVEHQVPVEEPPLSCGAPMRDAYVFEHGDFKVASDVPPGEAMQKIAGFWKHVGGGVMDSIEKIISGGKKVRTGVGGLRTRVRKVEKLTPLESSQLALAGAGVAAGLGAGAAGISAANERRRFSQVERALYQDPWFENLSDKSAVSEAYGLMKRYSPSIAKDPIVARSFVRVMVESPELKHTQTVQELLEAEKKFRESGAFTEDLFDLRRGIRGMGRALGLSAGKGGK